MDEVFPFQQWSGYLRLLVPAWKNFPRWLFNTFMSRTWAVQKCAAFLMHAQKTVPKGIAIIVQLYAADKTFVM